MRVWVTRDEPPDGPLSTALRNAGLTPVLEPVIARRVLSDAAEAIGKLGANDWLVLTSPFAVESVALEPACVPKVAVVGKFSAEAARSRGFRVTLVSVGADAKSLFNELRERVVRGKVCYPRSSLANPPDPLPGVELFSPVLYDTSRREFDETVLGRADVITVASPSAVDAIAAMGLQLRDQRIASIGATTSNALRSHTLEVWLEAPNRSFESLARAIADRRK